jgi:Cu-Zn family superoxide dismutase
MPITIARQRTLVLTAAALLVAGVAVAATPAAAQQARAMLTAPDGSAVGMVQMRETPHGVLLDVRIDKASPGAHGFHIHAVGTCTAPYFKSAGGHYEPGGREHGITNPKGKHAGDMPNIHVGTDGTAKIEILAEAVSLKADTDRAPLYDADGSAFVMHAGVDDYLSQPAGDAGGRAACGVIAPAG